MKIFSKRLYLYVFSKFIFLTSFASEAAQTVLFEGSTVAFEFRRLVAGARKMTAHQTPTPLQVSSLGQELAPTPIENHLTLTWDYPKIQKALEHEPFEAWVATFGEVKRVESILGPLSKNLSEILADFLVVKILSDPEMRSLFNETGISIKKIVKEQIKEQKRMNKNKKSTKIALLENAKSDPFSSQLREKTLRLYMHYTPKEVVFRATDNLGNTLNSIVANWIDHYTVSLQKAIVLKIRGAKMRGEPLGTLFIPQHTSLGQESTFETSDDYLIDMERDLLEFTLVKLLSFEKDIESYIINILSQYRVVEFCKSSVFSR